MGLVSQELALFPTTKARKAFYLEKWCQYYSYHTSCHGFIFIFEQGIMWHFLSITTIMWKFMSVLMEGHLNAYIWDHSWA